MYNSKPEQVKAITGGDRMRGKMHQDSWCFDPTHTLIIYTNHRPTTSGRAGRFLAEGFDPQGCADGDGQLPRRRRPHRAVRRRDAQVHHQRTSDLRSTHNRSRTVVPDRRVATARNAGPGACPQGVRLYEQAQRVQRTASDRVEWRRDRRERRYRPVQSMTPRPTTQAQANPPRVTTPFRISTRKGRILGKAGTGW